MKEFDFRISLLLLLTLVVLLSWPMACRKKTQEINISGQVYDPVLNKPVGNTLVKLSAKRIVSGVYSSGYQLLGTATTDQNGAFGMIISKEKTDNYRFVATADHYFNLERIITPDEVESSDNYSIKLDILPASVLELHIKNTNPFDNQDLVSWQISNATPECSDCCTNKIIKGYGNKFDTTLTCKLLGNRAYTIMYSSTKNNSTLIRTDTLYMPVFQTVQHNIFY